MFREGELMLRVGIAEQRIRTVGVASTRLPLPSKLTHGRTIAEVERTIPRLYSICARAQAAAAASALEAASGAAPDPARQFARASDVRREAIVELLTRLLIDWPRLLDLAPDVAAVARVRQATLEWQLDACDEVARHNVYGMNPAAWLEAESIAALERWADATATLPARSLQRLLRDAVDLGSSAIRPMPAVAIEGIAGMLPPLDGSADFSRTPEWAGGPVETGALARHANQPLIAGFVERHGNSVAARFLAQLVDLATALADRRGADDVQQHAPAPGVGIGLAQTARGLLLHHARVQDGRVKDYRIVAPTEWNFHPAGALTQGLVDRPVPDAGAARRDTALLVQALDPCVAYSIEVVDA
jgi:Ni,Fe-hydrogenase I large subunit